MNCSNCIYSPIYYGIPFVLSVGALTATAKAFKNFSKAFLGSDEVKNRFEKLSQSDSYHPVKESIQLFVGTNPLSDRVSELGQGFINLALAFTFLHVLVSTPYFENQRTNSVNPY